MVAFETTRLCVLKSIFETIKYSFRYRRNMNEYYLQFSNAKYLKKIRLLKSMTLAID